MISQLFRTRLVSAYETKAEEQSFILELDNIVPSSDESFCFYKRKFKIVYVVFLGLVFSRLANHLYDKRSKEI